MSFDKMMSGTTSIGTKGSDVYTKEGVGNDLVVLNALLLRGATRSTIHPLIKSCIEKRQIEDLFVLAFQTRDIRGGKGERDLFKLIYSDLLRNPLTTTLAIDLLDLLPVYGCWRDLFTDGFIVNNQFEFRDRIVEITMRNLKNDEEALSTDQPISLLAKWIPRENRNGPLASYIAFKLYPGISEISKRMRLYRKRIVALNRKIETTEIAMSGKHWSEIEPSKVPGRCLHKHMKAFLNETITGRQLIRHPNSEDRMECRKNFQDYFAKAATRENGVTINGSETIFPHELIRKVVKSICNEQQINEVNDPDERNALIAQWNSMVTDAKEGGGLGRSIVMCDFSGSMLGSGSNNDIPYYVSMAMGLLISEVTTDEFEDTMLTFDSTPKMHRLPKGTVFDRAKTLINTMSLGKGTSTDFQKAMDLILAELKAKRCLPGKEPDNLIVLTDMNWDEACGSNERSQYTGNAYRHIVKTSEWQTHVEMIREAFKRAGEDLHGEGNGWKMPRIIIWNIASTSTDFHAQADTEGVAMLSGWSPTLFKTLQSMGPDRVEPTTPMDILRTLLDDERYNLVRERIRDFQLREQ
jgi:hypothetical protein